jgi:hypothetical protein
VHLARYPQSPPLLSFDAAQSRSVPQITPHEVRQIPGRCRVLKTQDYQKENVACEP